MRWIRLRRWRKRHALALKYAHSWCVKYDSTLPASEDPYTLLAEALVDVPR